MSDSDCESQKSVAEKIYCKSCTNEVKRFIKCCICKKEYHTRCAIKIIGLLVVKEGIDCCSNYGSRQVVLQYTNPEIMNKLIIELEEKNAILKQNKELLEEKILQLKSTAENKSTNSYRENETTFANVVKKSNTDKLIIKPKDNEDQHNTLKNIKEIIDPKNLAEMSIGIESVKNIRGGGIVIGCTDQQARDKIRTKLSETMGNKYRIHEGTNLKPKVIIKGVEKEIINEDDAIILNMIFKQNQLHTEQKKIKIIKKFLSGKTKAAGNLIMEVDPEFFCKVILLKNLKLGWQNCRVSEYFGIVRCFKCCRYGHIAAKCEGKLTCGKCSGEHKTEECKSDLMKCVNCQDVINKSNIQIDLNHTVFDAKCKCYMKIVENIKSKINYNFL